MFELYSIQLGDLCCKRDPLGLMCLCSCPFLLTGAPSISVLESYQSGLCRSVGIYCMGSDILLLTCSPWTGSLGRTRTCRRVLVGWKDVLTPNGARILLMDSEVFFTYGIVT